MSDFDVNFDYLSLLGIDPAVVLRLAPEKIGEIVKAKHKALMPMTINPLYQHQAKLDIERLRQFEALAREPEALSSYVDYLNGAREERRQRQEDAVRALVAVASEGKNGITIRQRELIDEETHALGIDSGLVNEVIRVLGVQLIGGEKGLAERPKLPLLSPVMDGAVLTEIERWLKVLGRRSLYELVDLPADSSPGRLVSTARILAAHWSKVLPRTAESAAWEKAMQACATYLKDESGKARYDRSLFNTRVRLFAKRVDLVLSAASVAPDDEVRLIRIGFEDFGLDPEQARQCIAARSAELRAPLARSGPVVIQAQERVRCGRCFAWNGSGATLCRKCGGSLRRKCLNPNCRKPDLGLDVRSCESCGLPVDRGRQYRALMELADTLLDLGDEATARGVCQAAARILADEAVAERFERVGAIRAGIASIREKVARKAWTAVLRELPNLLRLAPRLSRPGIPELEKLTDYVVNARTKIQGIAPDADPIEAARNLLAWLSRWSDCEEVLARLRDLCRRLEESRDFRAAWRLASTLLEFRPDDRDASSHAHRLSQIIERQDANEAEAAASVLAYDMAVREDRLWAAERALSTIAALRRAEPANAAEVRAKIVSVREELKEIELRSTSATAARASVEDYLHLLRRCRDCHEARTALQSMPVDAPAPPRAVTVSREGNRRRLTWEPSDVGRAATTYLVQRSMWRSGTGSTDAPFRTVYQGPANHYCDDEVAHDGTIVRYSVQAIARGRIEVAGECLRDYEVASPPIETEALLVWQDARNLRSSRHSHGLELRWYQPPAARQVIIERWSGGPDDRPKIPAIVTATAEGLLQDGDLPEGATYTYRLRCVYDGPEGEFQTPGVHCTDATARADSRSVSLRLIAP